jgi:CPA1 family monovalent cation:H+ antiporter
MLRPTVGSGLVISWAGMRGILSLAASLALPPDFPFRGLIVFTAFAVVLGTLVIQGLTLKPLLRALDLRDDDPVGREVSAARERALHAGLATFGEDPSPLTDTAREEFMVHFAREQSQSREAAQVMHAEAHRAALQAARAAILEMRANDEIGDDAFHMMEEELDWLEMSDGNKAD